MTKSNLRARVARHEDKHPEHKELRLHLLTRDVIVEAVDALAVRARWYVVRQHGIPAMTMTSLRSMCAAVGLDPAKVLRSKVLT